MSAPTLKVLMLSPEPNVPGGVAVFAELLKKYVTRCEVTSFWVGSSPSRKENYVSRAARVLYAPLRLWWYLLHHHIDIVHINPSFDRNSLLRDGLMLLMLRLMRFSHVVVYFHGWLPSVDAFVRRSFFCRHLLVWLLEGAARILVLSPDVMQSLITFGVPTNRILRTSTMYDAAPLEEARQLPAYTKRRSILFMSRFLREKGVYELLEGFAHIAADFPDVDLILAGDGEEDAGLKKHAHALGIHTRVLFTGYVRGELKSRLLVHCTLFALPAYCPEGMPIALLEALGAGKPILTAKTGAIPYILTTPENGIILDNVSTQTIAGALRTLLNDPDYCIRVGTHNAVYGAQNFEARTITREMENLYYEIARL